MIIVSGFNVYPSMIEEVLESHEAVKKACVIGIPHPYKMHVPKAFLILKDGYQDSTCEKKYDIPLANSYACSSKMVNEYINWLKKQDFYSNTTIVLIGDHQVMQDSFYNDNKEYNRVIYNAFINSVNKGNNKNREFSQYDMYPTILASIGATIEGNKT